MERHVHRMRSVRLLALMTCAALVVGCGGPNPEVKRLMSDFKKLVPAMQRFQADCGRPPTQAEGLKAFLTKPDDPEIARRWNGPYVDSEADIIDQWGRQYFFGPIVVPNKDEPEMYMWSKGPDGEAYTADDVYDFGEGVPSPRKGKP